MKLLVFAHKPPPHHGQSYMVQLLVNALGGDVWEDRAAGKQRTGPRALRAAENSAIECYHLDCRFSKSLQDVGQVRSGKFFLALQYSLQAIWWRFRYGVTNFYYVPAFPNRAPIYRDWIVLGLCRPFFKKIVFHWHAVGLSEWLATEAKPWERWLSRRIYAHPDLSLILRPFNRTDAVAVKSKHIEVVPNGIPDPCPQFETEVLPHRQARIAARKKNLTQASLDGARPANVEPHFFRVLFVSLCYSGKGLFDTVEAVALANERLRSSALRLKLIVAGTFWLESEKREFEERIRQPDLTKDGPVVDYRGFVSGTDKHRLFMESDCLCFPTRMADSSPLVLVEGMAYGLPLITTDWRDIPEMLPPKYPGVVDPGSPDQIAGKLLELLPQDYDPQLRRHFLAHYTESRFGQVIQAALLKLQTG